MIRALTSGLLAFAAIFAVSALAVAEETVIESEHKTVEVVPEVKERVIEERTVEQRPAVQKRTDTVVTTSDNDNDDDDDDNDDDDND